MPLLFTIRLAVEEDAAAMAACQKASILALLGPVYGEEIALAWVEQTDEALLLRRLQSGKSIHFVAVENNT
jgi:hypothetical protein